MKTRLIHFFVFLFSIGFTHAQSYHFVNLTVEDGLSQNDVVSILQDKRGLLWMATKGGGVTVFAYPGNPVSTCVSCTYYFIPWLRKSLGLPKATESYAVLDSDFDFKPVLTYFLQVKLVNRSGTVYAIPEAGNGSGDLANLTLNDAFLKLDAERNQFKKGEIFPYFAFRQVQ